MRSWAALLCLLQMAGARVSIDVGAETTTVEAAYDVPVRDGELVLEAFRGPGQQLRLDSARSTPGALRLSAPPAQWRLDVGDGLAAGEPLRIVYEVTGNRRRVPVFVPRVPLSPGEDAAVLTLRGVGRSVHLEDGFPRMERRPDGSLRSTPSNLPSFVLVPPPSGRPSLDRLAEYAVLALVLGGTAAWLLWRRRAAGAPRG